MEWGVWIFDSDPWEFWLDLKLLFDTQKLSIKNQCQKINMYILDWMENGALDNATTLSD